MDMLKRLLEAGEYCAAGAYENPEKYKNIVVRVAGFSEYFYRLTDEMKKVVLRRTIQE
jgi:pyruvate-formate lyase